MILRSKLPTHQIKHGPTKKADKNEERNYDRFGDRLSDKNIHSYLVGVVFAKDMMTMMVLMGVGFAGNLLEDKIIRQDTFEPQLVDL